MATKNLLVYVPSSAVNHFTTNHTGSGMSTSDEYYEKVAFLEGQGTIATHGQIFGTSKAFSDDVTEFKNRVGLTEDITTSSTLTAYAKNVGSSVATLNGGDNVQGSVDYKIKTAIDNLVGNAPDAYNTVYELAAWLTKVQGTGTAEAVAATLANVNTIQSQLGTYTISGDTATYTGAYLFAHNAVVEAVGALKTSLTTTDTAVTGKYVSAVSISDAGVVTVSRGDLPTLSVAAASSSLVTVNDHEITLITTDLGSTSGISGTTVDNVTTYTAGTQTPGDGLITASAVYNRIHATEVYVADALTTLDARIASVVASATGDLDSHVTLTDSNNYGSVTIVQQDGILKTTDGTNTASLTINKTNILADASGTVDSSNNDYIQVHVTEENHKVNAVTVDFSPWENYSAS